MIIDYADFTKASGIIHSLQGAALLFLGAAEAYAIDNNGKTPGLAAGAVLALSGAAMFLVVLALPGGWSLEQLSEALSVRRGFYLFIAMACVFSAAGLSLITRAVLGRLGGGWQAMFLALLGFAGLLYFALGWRVNGEVLREILVWHYAMGVTLLLAVTARAADIFLKRRALRVAWAVLLLASGLQLVTYRENTETFAPKLVTLQASTETQPPPVNNAKPADKERAAD
jgi:hypothetical protein